MTLEEITVSGLNALSVPADDRSIERLRTYYEYLTEINRVMNLTAIQGEEDTARLHFLDCAAILSGTSMAGKKVIDVGTGAGFPGLVLKILCPGVSLTLLDSLDKRVNFLRSTCEKLDLDDVTCIHARAEEAPAEYRAAYDFAVSRAVARLNVLCELCLPFVKKGGMFLAMKGTDHQQELQQALPAIRKLGGRLESTRDYTIPGTEITHSLILIRKTGDTPAAYPRRWAQIKKLPLA